MFVDSVVPRHTLLTRCACPTWNKVVRVCHLWRTACWTCPCSAVTCIPSSTVTLILAIRTKLTAIYNTKMDHWNYYFMFNIYFSSRKLRGVHKCQHFYKCTNHTLSGERVCENQHFFCTLLSFWPDFYYFNGDFCHSKNVDVYSFWGRGGLTKCMVCTLVKMLTFMDGP